MRTAEVCGSPLAEQQVCFWGACGCRGAKESLKNKVFFLYQGSCGESAADRLLWLPSVSIPCPRRVWLSALCARIRAEPCGKTGGERVRRAGRVWPGVTERGAGQMQAGTDSSSPSTQSPLQSLFLSLFLSRSLIPPPRHAAPESNPPPTTRPLPLLPVKIKARCLLERQSSTCVISSSGFREKCASISKT